MTEEQTADILSMTASLLESYQVPWIMHEVGDTVVFGDIGDVYTCLAVIHASPPWNKYDEYRSYIKFLKELAKFLNKRYNKVARALRQCGK